MHARMLAVLASLALAAPLLSVPVYAAGDGGGGDTPVAQCKKGQVWDEEEEMRGPGAKLPRRRQHL